LPRAGGLGNRMGYCAGTALSDPARSHVHFLPAAEKRGAALRHSPHPVIADQPHTDRKYGISADIHIRLFSDRPFSKEK